MAENNRAEVKIYGQQYTIAGTASIEDMERVAEYVDGIMNHLSKNLPSLTTVSLAVLSAVNVASEYFELVSLSKSQGEEIESMKRDIENYSRLWEDAKHSLLKYQEETRDGVQKLQDLQQIFNKKSTELNQMREALEDTTAKYQETLKLLKAAEAAVSQIENRTDEEVSSEELKTLQGETGTLQQANDELQKQMEALQKANDELQEQTDALQSENDELQKQTDALQSENDELQKQTDALQSENDELQKQADALQSENDELQKQTNVLQREKDDLQRKADSLEKKISEMPAGDKPDLPSMSEFHDRYRELENSFFDVQMENIQLRNELEQYRKQDS